MIIAPYTGGENPLDMTVARFLGIIDRIPKLLRMQSGKPPSPEERAAEWADRGGDTLI